MATEPVQLRVLRQLLLAIMIFSTTGTAVELVLLEHYDTRIQWIPLIALVIGTLASIVVLVRPGRHAIRFFQAVMIAFVAAGLAGVYFHFNGNIEFAQETYPDAAGLTLFWEAATGATPALAPGTIVQLGLLGLAAMYRHPRMRQ